ncbi:hypothetical protein U1Q18_025955, partial [Sarracenia purpurea var. burkii]
AGWANAAVPVCDHIWSPNASVGPNAIFPLPQTHQLDLLDPLPCLLHLHHCCCHLHW